MPATLLLVDDDMALVQLMAKALEGEGYLVLKGFDGQMAVQLAQTQKPELIVMDVDMPMTHGLKALDFLRKSPATAKIPVIFLTGAQSERVSGALEQASRVAHLKKPLDLEELSSLVRHFLDIYPVSA